MTIRDGWPYVSGKADALDIRLALGGQFISPGLFPGFNRQILVAGTGMNLSVRQFTAVLSRGETFENPGAMSPDGAGFIANYGTHTVGIPQAPLSNAILHTVYVKQNNPLYGENDAATITYVSSPVAPANQLVKQQVPDGAEELGTVLVPAGATSLTSSGVVITNTSKPAIASQGDTEVANAAERDRAFYGAPSAWSTTKRFALQGTRVVRLDTGWTEQYYYEYNAASNPGGARGTGAAGMWLPVFGTMPTLQLSVTAANTAAPGEFTQKTNLSGGVVRNTGTFGVGGGTFIPPFPGNYQLSARVAVGGNSGGTRAIQTVVGGQVMTQDIPRSPVSAAGIMLHVADLFYSPGAAADAADSQVSVEVYQDSPNYLSLSTMRLYCQYLGPC
jgi:hypothetical protein